MVDKKSKKIKDSAAGFGELLDEYLEEKEAKERRKRLQNDKSVESYKAYNFLEIEKERVEKLRQMFSNNIPNFLAHSQANEIITKQTTYNYRIKDEILDEIKKFDSIFNKNIRSLFNSAFKNNE